MSNIYYADQREPSAPYVRGRKEGKLIDVHPILLYHTYWGRNAWNSTWILQYYPNTLLNSYAEAQKFVDQRKTQGSVFGLIVLPGWMLDFGVVRFIVTEINTNQPFLKLEEAKFLDIGRQELDCLSYLQPDSDIWSPGQRQRNGIIVEQTGLRFADFVSWEDRTQFPGQQKTVGRYKRVASSNPWCFAPERENGSFGIETKFFESYLGGETI